MNIAISNLAFQGIAALEVPRRVRALSIHGIEIAPTLFWDDPCATTKEQRRSFRSACEDYGITVVGLQSLLYGKPELRLFDSPQARYQCAEHLKRLMELCADINGTTLTFGSPKNRRCENCSPDETYAIAVSFFSELAQAAADHGLYFCVEPLAKEYECNFIITADEGAHLVERVNHPHFRLLLDTGSMSLSKESPVAMLQKHVALIRHIHINDPFLNPPGVSGINHKSVAEALAEINYDKWLSLEFTSQNGSLDDKLKDARALYGF